MLLSNGRIGLVQTGAGYALVAEGDVSLVGISGITISGHASVRVNTTDSRDQPDADDPGQHRRRRSRSKFTSTADVKSFGVIGAQITHPRPDPLRQRLVRVPDGGDIAVAATNVTLALTGVSLTERVRRAAAHAGRRRRASSAARSR